MTSPFDYVNSVSYTKEDLIASGSHSENDYNPYLTNRALSYHVDAVLFSNEMNQRPFLDKRLQYDFYLNGLRKNKRYSKWLKPEVVEEISLIATFYRLSYPKAKEFVGVLTAEQLQKIKEDLEVLGFGK